MSPRALGRLFSSILAISIAWNFGAIALPFIKNDFPLVFLTVNGIETVHVSSLSLVERVICVSIVFIPQYLWIYALLALRPIGRIFDRPSFFSSQIVSSLESFGKRLLVQGVVQPWIVFIVAFYLHSLGRIGSLNLNLDDLYSLGESFDMIAASLLITLIAQILRHGIEIEAESKLTV